MGGASLKYKRIPNFERIEVVHDKLVVAREQLGAHDSYADSRFARELLRKRDFDRKKQEEGGPKIRSSIVKSGHRLSVAKPTG